MSYGTYGNDQKPPVIPHKTVFWVNTFLLTCYMRARNNYITPATSENYIWHPIANKIQSLNCWYFLWCAKNCSHL